jgi:hypothetical protein
MKCLKPRLIIVFIVVALLILGSVGSFGISNAENEKHKITRTMIKKPIFNSVNPEMESKSEKFNSLGLIGNNPYDNVVVTNTNGSESYPSIVMNGYAGMVAYEYNDGNESKIFLRNSNDYGQNWSGEVQVIAKLQEDPTTPIEINSPSLCIKPLSNKGYGMFTSPLKNSAIFGYLEIRDITNINSFTPYAFDWTGLTYPGSPEGVTYDFWDFDAPKIITYKNTTTPWIIALTGSTNFSVDGVGPCKDSPMFCFQDLIDPETYVTLTWYSEIEHCSNISISNDYGNKNVYGICEINNGSKQDLLFFKGNPRSWYYGSELSNLTISTESSLTHPYINVIGDNIFVVADSDSDGIVLLNSSDGGDSWNIKEVTKDIVPPSADPNYPMIYSNGESLYCTYIESNNILMTSSTNNGQNWSDPMQLNSVNNSVVETHRFSDLLDDKHVLWTDNRNGNYDIYSILLEVPGVDLTVVPGSVDIESEYKNVLLLNMKNWITFTIKNNGNIFVEKVIINVSYKCINESSKPTNYKATLYYLRPGEEESFRRPLFRLTLTEFFNALIDFAGIQNLTVTIDPKYKDINPQDNSYTIEVIYKDIFPRMGFLEPIFSIL